MIAGLAAGNFQGGPDDQLALLAENGQIHVLGVTSGAASLHRLAAVTAGSKLVSAKVSTGTGQDLVVLDRAHRQLHFSVGAGDVTSFETEAEPRAVLPMRLSSSARRSLVLLRQGHRAPAVALAAAGPCSR